MDMERRTKLPPHINIAGQQDLVVTIDFIASTRAGLDEYLADIIDIIKEKATTRTIQEKHELGVRDIQVQVIRWPARVSY